jgi:hypothetical protein
LPPESSATIDYKKLILRLCTWRRCAPIDYSKNAHVVWFFVDTLDFVFGASDLIDSGWDIESWSQIPTSGSHPFGHYRLGYVTNLQALKQALS